MQTPQSTCSLGNHTLCIFWTHSLSRKSSCLFCVTIFPHGLCITWWRNNQNHVLNWPVFKPEAASVKAHAQQAVWAAGRELRLEPKSQKGHHLRILGLKTSSNSVSASLGTLPTSPLVSWPSGSSPQFPTFLPACCGSEVLPAFPICSPFSYLPSILDPSPSGAHFLPGSKKCIRRRESTQSLFLS